MKTSSGPKSVQQHLARLTIAAILAVGWFAMARPAEAEIVYTPTNITIGPNGSYSLDVNNDGITDFTISVYAEGPGICCVTDGTGIVCARYYMTHSADETPASGTSVVGSPPAALNSGDQIGPSQAFYGGTGTLESVSSSCKAPPVYSGEWVTSSVHYLGLALQVNGQTCYGWAQLRVEVKPGLLTGSAKLTGYAYETVPGTPINAGQMPPNFKIKTSPTSATVSPGQSTISTLTLTPVGGFSGTVALTCRVPSGDSLSCEVSPSSVTLDGTDPLTATLSINTSSSSPASIYKINAKGTSGTFSHTATLTVTVQ